MKQFVSTFVSGYVSEFVERVGAFFAVCALVLLTQNALAITPREQIHGLRSLAAPNGLQDIFKFFSFSPGASDYQIGEEWGKKPVTATDLLEDEHFRRMSFSTVKIATGGTGFYLGQFGGEFVVATNHHVCEEAWLCSGFAAIDFTELGFKTQVKSFFGSWPEIDLALFTIEASEEQRAQLATIGTPLAFKKDLKKGDRLLTIGYGMAENPARVQMANRDNDCVVFSGDAEYRLLADPDDFNPASYKAWSFANGCDVSHGDSGSAMMNRDTGEVIGIIWTGKIPKSEKVKSAAYLAELLAQPSEDVWEELSYGVPAVEMAKYLRAEIDRQAFPPQDQLVLEVMLK